MWLIKAITVLFKMLKPAEAVEKWIAQFSTNVDGLNLTHRFVFTKFDDGTYSVKNVGERYSNLGIRKGDY